MPKRGENIHKRKDGRWEARYKKGVNQAGKTIYGSVYGKTYREVKEKQLEKMQLALACAPVKRSMRFADVLSLWLADSRIRLKGATEYRYRYLIDTHILPELGGKTMEQITGPLINIFLAEKMASGRLDGTGGLSPAYVRSIMLIIQSVLDFAAAMHLCQPIQAKINKPRFLAKEVPMLCTEDQRKLEEFCLTDTDETKAGILLSLYAGLRIGEVCALSWNDIDFQAQIIHVRHTVSRVKNDTAEKVPATILILERPKTMSSLRDIPLCSRLLPVLRKLKEQTVSEFVISRDAGFVSPRTYEYRYHKVLRASGVPEINYHALRHTFATRCIESGVDVKSLSEILGHADASITLNTYVHSSLERKRSQLELLHF